MNLEQIKQQVQANAILGALLSDGSITVLYKQPTTDEALLFRTWEIEVLIVDEDYTDQVRRALDSLGYQLVQLGSRVKASKDVAITTEERGRINAATEAAKEAQQQAKAAAKEQATAGTLAGLQDQIAELKEDVDLMGLVRPASGSQGARGAQGAAGRDGRDIDATQVSLGDLQDVTGEEPRQGQILMWQEIDQSWELRYPPQGGGSIGGGGGGGGTPFPEAPEDGKQYARKDAAWSEIVIPEGGSGQINSDTIWSEVLPTERQDGNGELRNGDTWYNPANGFLFIWGEGSWYGLVSPNQGGGGLDKWTETSEGHLLPDGAGQNLGSLEQPVGELYISGQTVFLDGVPLSLNANNRLQFDGNQLGYGDGEVEEAPLDGKYYVRHMGQWVEGPTNSDPSSIIDGGDFDTGSSLADSDAAIDGGDFDQGLVTMADKDAQIAALQQEMADVLARLAALEA